MRYKVALAIPATGGGGVGGGTRGGGDVFPLLPEHRRPIYRDSSKIRSMYRVVETSGSVGTT